MMKKPDLKGGTKAVGTNSELEKRCLSKKDEKLIEKLQIKLGKTREEIKKMLYGI